MGTIFSSRKDYNRVLARQPRKSIGLSKFDVPNYLHTHPVTEKLSIPEPVRFSQSKPPIDNFSNKSLNTALSQVSPIQSPSVIDNNIEQEKFPIKKQLIQRSSSYSFEPNVLMYNPTMNNNAVIIARSVMNLNNHTSSFRPNRTVFERNGKQFLTEFKERMERRYVQIFDENIGQNRLYEVTDYIPSRTIRSMKTSRPFPLRNRNFRNNLPSNFPLNQRSAFLPTLNRRIEPVTTTSLMDFKELNNRETLAREFDQYISGINLPFNNINNNNVQSTNPTQPQLTQDSLDYGYTYPQPQPPISSIPVSQNAPSQYGPGSYRSPQTPISPTPLSQNAPSQYAPGSYRSQNAPSQYSPGSYRSPQTPISRTPQSQNTPNQNSPGSYRSAQPSSYRPHSPTVSEYSKNSPDANSMISEQDTDSEAIDRTLQSNQKPIGNNRNSTAISYGTGPGNNLQTSLDPFAKTTNQHDHLYAKRRNINNYSEPVRNNRGFQTGTGSDYAPIPMAHRRSNQNHYSRRKDSDAYNG